MKKILLILTIASFLSACVSLQDSNVSDTEQLQAQKNLAMIEEMIVPLEALGGALARMMQPQLDSARGIINDLENEASTDADYTGQLIAWSGRLAILEGRYSEAMRLYRESSSVSAGNVPLMIFGIRLEGDPEQRLKMTERELENYNPSSKGYGELQIEKARNLYELNRYSESVTAFDEAFISEIADVYRECYTSDRNRARDLTSR